MADAAWRLHRHSWRKKVQPADQFAQAPGRSDARMISDYRRPPSRSIDGVIAAVPASHSSCEERLDQVPMPSHKEVDAAMKAAATLIPEPTDPNIHSENAILTSRL
jgi:hypothetical protein